MDKYACCVGMRTTSIAALTASHRKELDVKVALQKLGYAACVASSMTMLSHTFDTHEPTEAN